MVLDIVIGNSLSAALTMDQLSHASSINGPPHIPADPLCWLQKPSFPQPVAKEHQ